MKNINRNAFVSRFEENKLYDCTYYHNPNRWNEIPSTVFSSMLEEGHWSKLIKYLDKDNNDISPEINSIPDNKGGVYIFFIVGPTLPFIERYIAYIGRAQSTPHQNIRKRVKEYLRESNKVNGRHKIVELFKHWKDYLYLMYFECEDNEQIVQLEGCLIHSILPPFNDDIPYKIEIKTPQKAF